MSLVVFKLLHAFTLFDAYGEHIGMNSYLLGSY